MLAILLPGLLLYGDVFYSGHLFVVSLFIVLGAWRMLTWLGLPFLTLEPVAGSSPFDRRTSIVVLAILLVAAFFIDSFMSARFE